MNYTQTVEQMRSLRLHGMADALQNLIDAKQTTTLTAEQLIVMLIQHEHDERHGRKIDRLTKAAKFRYNAALDQIRPDANRDLDATVLAQLTTCSWIDNNENILITGPAGDIFGNSLTYLISFLISMNQPGGKSLQDTLVTKHDV